MKKSVWLWGMGVVGIALLLVAVPLLGACGETEVIKEVPVEKVVEKEVIKEVPVEKVVEKEVIKEVPVEKVVEKEVIKEVAVMKPPIGVVKVGHLGDLTGPASSVHRPWCESVMNYWKWLNEKGGILYKDPITGEMERVTVDATMVDTQYKAANAISAFEKFNTEGVVLEAGSATGMHAAIEALTVKYEIPFINGGFFKFLYPPEEKWGFGSAISIAEEYLAAVYYLKEQWEKGEPVVGVEPDPSRKMRIGLMQSEASWGFKWYEEGVMDWIKSVADVIGPETYPAIPTDVSPQLMKINRGNPDYILNLGITAELGVCLKDAKRLGITAPQLTCSGVSLPDIIQLAGAEACEGQLFCLYFDTFGMDPKHELSEGAKLTKTIHEKYMPGKPLSSWEIQGISYGVTMVEVIRMALEEVGYDNLTGRAVKEYGLEMLKDFDAMGIPASSMTFGPDDHLGPEAGNLYTSRDGMIVPIKRPMPIPTELLVWE